MGVRALYESTLAQRGYRADEAQLRELDAYVPLTRRAMGLGN